MDITSRVKAEASTREKEKQFRELLESAPDAMVIMNESGEIVRVNSQAEKLFRYDRSELLGQKIEILVSPRYKKHPDHSRKYTQDPRPRLFSTKEALSGLKKDGDEFPIDVSLSPLKTPDGMLLTAAIRDVTEQVKIKQKIEDALEEAQQANKVKDLFLANMSHEIRTPLNSILGFTQLLKDKCQSQNMEDDENKMFFDAVDGSGQRLIRTVHEILDISQIESGVYKYQTEQFDLIELVNSIVNELRLSAEKKDLTVEVSHESQGLIIDADKYTISQAISNLVDNAIKYTDQGGVYISTTRINGQYELQIKDTGIGISKEYMKNMYNVFTQESEGYTKAYQGIGLGLAIAKHGLDLNNIRLDVKSQKDEGTTFTLTFHPVDGKVTPDKKEPVEKPKQIQLKTDERKPSILVVEDDKNAQNLIKFFLKDTGSLFMAESVAEAREKIKKNSVDLVLLDLSLKGNEDGLDFVKYLRKNEQWMNIPIIASTAHAFTTDREKCLTAGCHDYLAKPIRKEQLLDKIQIHLN